MSNFGFDDWIDAQLRNVPVPPELLSRLSETTGGDAVPTPPPIDPTIRLYPPAVEYPQAVEYPPAVQIPASQVPASAVADARMDAVLRKVPVPDYLDARLRRIARQRRPAPLWLRAGWAAAAFVAIGLGAAGYVGLLSGNWGQRSDFLAANTDSGQAAENRAGDPQGPRARRLVSGPVRPAILADSSNGARSNTLSRAHTAEETAQAARQTRDLVDRVAVLGTTVREAIDAQVRTRAALGAGGRFERLPNLEALEAPVSHGMSPPLVRGYDLLFQLKHGEHPIVSPAADKSLQSIAMPLSFGTASYDLALRGATAGQLPPADEIRVEDFLAAQRYALDPAPFNALALHVAATPAPLGARGEYFAQVAVQTGPNRFSEHPPARLLVALDTSSAMAHGARWEAVRRALARLARDMAPEDRLSLIGFAESPRLLAERASAAELTTLLADDTLGTPGGSADLPAAMRLASDLVRALPSGESRQVIFITAGREDFDDAALSSSTAALAKLSGARIPWQIIRLTPGVSDSQLSALAAQGHGEIVTADSAVAIHRALARQLIGRSSSVASRVALKMTFNPQAVTGYRLLGNESRTLTGLSSPPLEVDLEADELATDMLQLWLKPGPDDHLALVELSWSDPSTDQQFRQAKVLRRAEIAPTFAKAPTWLQQGVIAAATAEALRGGYFAPASRPFGQVLALAAQVDAGVAQQPDFQALLSMLRQADKRR